MRRMIWPYFIDRVATKYGKAMWNIELYRFHANFDVIEYCEYELKPG